MVYFLGLSQLVVQAADEVRFVLLNLVGAALWATIFTTLGYVFGYSIQSVFAQLEIVERGVIAVLVVVAIGLTLYFGYRQWGPMIQSRSKRRKPKAGEELSRENGTGDD